MKKPRERVLMVLLRILAHPYRFTKRDLAERYKMSKDAITEDLEAMRNIGLHIEYDNKYRYAIIPDRQFQELKQLQSLNDSDIAMISNALKQNLSGKDVLYLNNKLSSLYDFQRLGLRALRRPALEKIDSLEKAKKDEIQVILKNYRSNSNSIKDRTVEAFHIDPELDTIQAYDVDAQKTSHFKLSRIERVVLTETTWCPDHNREYRYTDVFRIADNNQVSIHLRLQVYAYNALIEAYPKALSDILPASEPNTFDFETKVNHQYLGLMNFILGNYGQLTIIRPQELKEKVMTEAQKILSNNSS